MDAKEEDEEDMEQDKIPAACTEAAAETGVTADGKWREVDREEMGIGVKAVEVLSILCFWPSFMENDSVGPIAKLVRDLVSGSCSWQTVDAETPEWANEFRWLLPERNATEEG